VVPEAIGNLTALNGLWLNGNQLTVVPDAIGNLTALTALTSLDVSDNKLTLVPEAIGKLTALTELGLSGNPILETAKVLNSAGTDPEGS
jgi:Leucine-rich repeat (LRR) protein